MCKTDKLSLGESPENYGNLYGVFIFLLLMLWKFKSGSYELSN